VVWKHLRLFWSHIYKFPTDTDAKIDHQRSTFGTSSASKTIPFDVQSHRAKNKGFETGKS
jgi:hypothetical protein